MEQQLVQQECLYFSLSVYIINIGSQEKDKNRESIHRRGKQELNHNQRAGNYRVTCRKGMKRIKNLNRILYWSQIVVTD